MASIEASEWPLVALAALSPIWVTTAIVAALAAIAILGPVVLCIWIFDTVGNWWAVRKLKRSNQC